MGRLVPIPTSSCHISKTIGSVSEVNGLSSMSASGVIGSLFVWETGDRGTPCLEAPFGVGRRFVETLARRESGLFSLGLNGKLLIGSHKQNRA